MKARRLVAFAGSLALLGVGALVTVPPAGGGIRSDPQQFVDDGQYTVPDGICQVAITAYGGAGAVGGDFDEGSGGSGGAIEASFAVVAGSTLDVFVGKQGNPFDAMSNPGAGGSGYKNGGDGTSYSGGGGGASAVVYGGDVLIVAGGGGGGAIAGDGGDGGVGGFGAGDGQAGAGSGGGAGGTVGDPNIAADKGGDGVLGAAGGGAGSGPGDAGDADTDEPGGGGASAVSSSALGLSSDPGGAPTGDGSVTITPAEPGIGCDPTLAVAKVVSGPSTTGFTVEVTCTREREIPAEVEAAETETVVDGVDLPYEKDGLPDATNPPTGWSVVEGVWAFSDADLEGSTCTAVETATGGALSVSYGCEWTAGVLDHLVGVGCPGEAGGPSVTPLSVTFEGDGDVGVLTVTNTFAVAVELEPTFAG